MRSRVQSRHISKIVAVSVGLFGLPLSTSSTVAARDTPNQVTITLDPVKTSIQWTLPDVLHIVHGSFTLKNGVIHLNPATGATDGLIAVDAGSGKSGSEARDKRMRKEILESDRYPDISFRPTQAFGTLDFSKDQLLAVDGIFHLHGEDHALQLHVHLEPQGNNHELHVTTQFNVPYVQWGLKNPSTFILRVGQTVAINVDSTVVVHP